jgi:hypothetical protein
MWPLRCGGTAMDDTIVLRKGPDTSSSVLFFLEKLEKYLVLKRVIFLKTWILFSLE